MESPENMSFEDARVRILSLEKTEDKIKFLEFCAQNETISVEKFNLLKNASKLTANYLASSLYIFISRQPNLQESLVEELLNPAENRNNLLGHLLLWSTKQYNEKIISILLSMKANPNYKNIFINSGIADTPLMTVLKSTSNHPRDETNRLKTICVLLKNEQVYIAESEAEPFYGDKVLKAISDELMKLAELDNSQGFNETISVIKYRLSLDEAKHHWLKVHLADVILRLAQNTKTRALSAHVWAELKDALGNHARAYQQVLIEALRNKNIDKSTFQYVLDLLKPSFDAKEYGLWLKIAFTDIETPDEGKYAAFFAWLPRIDLFLSLERQHTSDDILLGALNNPNFPMQIFSELLHKFKPSLEGVSFLDFNKFSKKIVVLGAEDLSNNENIDVQYGKKLCILALVNSSKSKIAAMYKTLIDEIKAKGAAVGGEACVTSVRLTRVASRTGINYLQFLADLETKVSAANASNNPNYKNNFAEIVSSEEKIRDILSILTFAVGIESPLCKVASEYIELLSMLLVYHQSIKTPSDVDFNYFSALSSIYDNLSKLQNRFPAEKDCIEKFKENLRSIFEKCLKGVESKLCFSSGEAEILKQSDISFSYMGSTRRKISAMVQPNIGTNPAASFSGSRPVSTVGEGNSVELSSNFRRGKGPVGGGN